MFRDKNRNCKRFNFFIYCQYPFDNYLTFGQSQSNPHQDCQTTLNLFPDKNRVLTFLVTLKENLRNIPTIVIINLDI